MRALVAAVASAICSSTYFSVAHPLRETPPANRAATSKAFRERALALRMIFPPSFAQEDDGRAASPLSVKTRIRLMVTADRPLGARALHSARFTLCAAIPDGVEPASWIHPSRLPSAAAG